MASDPDFTAPKGTNDLLPPQSWAWTAVTRRAMDMFGRAGYAPMETPIFEHTELFERGVGEGTEVVGKQMYTFTDRGDRSLTLRPEGTAPVMRAVLEHNLHRAALPIKLAYLGPMFRQERPQKGRHRQFTQVGIEAIGSEGPLVDAEVIELGARFLAEAGVDATLLLNSIGHPDTSCRGGYLKLLVEFLEEHTDDIASADRYRISTNPLRTFDSKESQTQEVLKGAPRVTDHLCDDCRGHFEALQEALSSIDLSFELQPTLVRGLDYYTRTAFEFVATGLGSKDTVLAGGRYDGLSESLGGPPLPGIGFAAGIDRIVLAAGDEETPETGLDAYLVVTGYAAEERALGVATTLRRAGIGISFDIMGRGMKAQMKEASRSGAPYAVILGDEELSTGTATLKDLGTGDQESVALTDLAGRLAR